MKSPYIWQAAGLAQTVYLLGRKGYKAHTVCLAEKGIRLTQCTCLAEKGIRLRLLPGTTSSPCPSKDTCLVCPEERAARDVSGFDDSEPSRKADTCTRRGRAVWDAGVLHVQRNCIHLWRAAKGRSM
eukprot:scaffold20429_cov19-Tisochrysis_lutea.AAC.2